MASCRQSEEGGSEDSAHVVAIGLALESLKWLFSVCGGAMP